MPENLLPLTTHTAPRLDPNSLHDLSSSQPLNAAQPSGPALEEAEPYTIKCICTFSEDDGSTVFCEECETWQHIDCYYPTKKVPEVHNCVDCEPRPLDPRRATERQKKRKENIDPSDRKPKRPPTKSHKKKVKDPNHGVGQVNGWPLHDRVDVGNSHDHRSRSPRDQPPPAKRPKTSHRTSSSISSQAGTPSAAALEGHRRMESISRNITRSTTTSPSNPLNGYHREPYSVEFMRLHRNDPGDFDMQANLFSNIGVTGSLSSWIQDPDSLAQVTNGKAPQEVFQRLEQPIETLTFPDISKHFKEDCSVEYDGTHPLWQYLTVEHFVPTGGFVGELKGQIGHRQDYCNDPANRYISLQHPEPFVFFHPQLPIYIDTRKEGTRYRYARRSCRPNLIMNTIITNGTEYHFCLFAADDLAPGTEITIGWDIDERIRAYLHRCLDRPRSDASGNGVIKEEVLGDEEIDHLSTWVSRVLANFGGCACQGPQQCALAQFDRRIGTALRNHRTPPTNGVKPQKSKKSRSHTSPGVYSPLVNDQGGTDSHSHGERNDARDESRSTSTSVRSKPPSRDMTPSAPGPELSDREKRKIAALEKTFEQLEQDNQHQVHKKKKRNSGGSNLNTPSAAASVSIHQPGQRHVLSTDLREQKQLGHTHPSVSQPHTPSNLYKAQFVDASTSRRQSGSPLIDPHHIEGMVIQTSNTHTPRTTPPANRSWNESRKERPNYRDSTTQTKPENNAWYTASSQMLKRKSFVSLTKRLLLRCHEDRKRLDEERKGKEILENGTTADMSPSTQHGCVVTHEVPPSSVEVSWADHEDVPMPDSVQDPGRSTLNASDQSIIQQPRPPHEGTSTTWTSQHSEASIKAPPLPPPTWPSAKYPTSPDDHHNIIRYRGADLHVDLPPAPQFSNVSPTSAGTPTSAITSIAQSPLSFGAAFSLPCFSPLVNSIVQPSPIKKKLSLSDYAKRKKQVDAPSSDKAHHGSSPTMPHHVLKSSSSLAEEARLPGNLEGNAILETPVMEEANPLGSSRKSKVDE
ncbi:MAG: hypothetical protein M1827_003990 [Pycnora praestabilis]|nr:MAG: hypothetical protein M1827_003990 [Pycnora praestabilis]